MLQKNALKILKSGYNVFLTGAAGTGKTYVINQYIQLLRERGVKVAITASTGIAATHIGGQTIHSWSGLGIKEEITQQDLEKIAKRKKVRERIEKTQVLIIDEISMLSGKTLENIDEILRYFKVSFEPFGGIQVIFSGDFFQLPPVSKNNLPNHLKFAFMSPIWVKLKLKVCYLTEQFRQNDDSLNSFLNEIRSGEISDSAYDVLNENIERAQEESEFIKTKLFTHNADVNRVNQEELEKLQTPHKTFSATKSGTSQLLESLKKSVLTEEHLHLKEGSQVIFVKNNYEEGYLNGTMGTITGFCPTEGWPIVTTFDDKDITAKPDQWSIDDELGKPLAIFAQVPLKLAWAITVHKSQGMTLDSAEIDLSKTFESGQGYVALSRVKSWSGLRLLGCNQTALQLDPLALKADKRFQELSDEVEELIGKTPDKTHENVFKDFIIRSGGTNNPEEIKEFQIKIKLPKKTEPKLSTYKKTKDLLEKGHSILDIMHARSLNEDTVINHISKLKKEDKELNIDHINTNPERTKNIIAKILQIQLNPQEDQKDQHGNIKLRTIFDALNEEYNYREIKIARLFLDTESKNMP